MNRMGTQGAWMCWGVFAIAWLLSLHTAAAQCLTISNAAIAPEHCGLSDGQITVTHTGSAPFTYVWSHNAALNAAIAPGLAAGNYTVRVTDNAGCTAETTLTVPSAPLPSASIVSVTNVRCAGGRDGGATLQTDPANTIVWNTIPQQTGPVLSGAAQGNYLATIRDAFGCSITIGVVINEPNPLNFFTSVAPDTCGTGRGLAAVLVTGGGTPPITYAWSTGQTGSTVTNAAAGNYSVTLTDGNGCTQTTSLTVPNQTNGFEAEVQASNPRCWNSSDGAAIAIATGGTGQYSYQWVTPAGTVVGTSANLTNVPAGIYSLIMTDPQGPGCRYTWTVRLQAPDSLDVQNSVTPTTGCRAPDGQIVLLTAGGIPPYTFTWDNGSTNDTLTGLRAGFYDVVVSDANGCTQTRSIAVTSRTGPFFTVDVVQSDDCGLGQGIARVNITSGLPPYRIEWFTNPLQGSDTARYAYNLFATTPQDRGFVVIRDADSCLNTVVFDVPGAQPLRVAAKEAQADYCGLSNGSARVLFEGGTLPYRYAWSTSPIQTSLDATGLPAAAYQVTVRDALNCTLTEQVVVPSEPGFTLSASATDETCFGAADGTAAALAAGGPGGWTYTWDNGSSGSSLSGLQGGLYTVTATDSRGCTRTAFTEVNGAPFLRADFSYRPDSAESVVLSQATFYFTDRSEGVERYFWSFGDGSFSTDASPVHTYRDTGTFMVRLRVEHTGGCPDSVEYGPITVRRDGVLYIPNAFSPNGDGFNDFFFVRGERIQTYSLRIFSRWGEEVFASSSPDQEWDGRLRTGRAAPSGVYVYRVEAVLAGSTPFTETGTLTLVR
ncbi:MAG: gliding motility-associated C-terminal domain-containing protein [Bacteroidia bacterium]|nr:gliding motility-associated C-terminal domain-containing protein [Bacteroidia bacterium]